jgi:hypothetical protein
VQLIKVASDIAYIQAIPGIEYICGVDLSTGIAAKNGDSSAACVCHYDPISGRSIVDDVIVIDPPNSADGAIKQICEFIRPFNIIEVYGDRVGMGFSQGAFLDGGVQKYNYEDTAHVSCPPRQSATGSQGSRVRRRCCPRKTR